MAKNGDKKDGGVLEVRHYRSSDKGDGKKEVIIERVMPDSETARFLARMEARRIAQRCDQNIDLRGRVNSECKRYVHMTQVHYLDDESYKIFREGLQHYGGKFTVSTYEAINTASHVKNISGHETAPKPRAPKSHVAPTAAASNARSAPTPTTAASISTTETTPPPSALQGSSDYFSRPNPPVLPFGYYRKRRELRLIYATQMALESGAEVIIARTRDLSLGGCFVAVENGCLSAGQTVTATFSELLQEHPDAPLQNITYNVARVDTKDDETTAVLLRNKRSAENDFNTFLEKFIDQQKTRHKLDPEDDANTATALSYQRIYAEASHQLPLFFRIGAQGQPYIHTMGLTKNNEELLSFFQDNNGNFDFSPLRIPSRMRHFCMSLPSTALRADAPGMGETMLILYKDKQGAICSAFDFELSHPGDVARLVRHALVHKEFLILKATVTLVRDHNRDRMALLAAPLDQKSPSEAAALWNEMRSIVAIGTLVDITDAVRTTLFDSQLVIDPKFSLEGLRVWRANQQIDLVPQTTDAPYASDLCPAPITVQFGLSARRREERYLAKTKIELLYNGQRFSGITRDLSTRGLCVLFEQPVPLRARDDVGVAFMSFTPEQYDCDIRNIRYHVLKVMSGDITAVALERDKCDDWDAGTTFFSEIIDINKQKLGVCSTDVQSNVTARLYEDVFAAHLQTMPVFIGKDDHNKPAITRVGVSEKAPELADFFYISKDTFDYRALSQADVLEFLTTMPRGHNNRGYPGTTLYLYRENDPRTNSSIVRAALGSRFTDTKARMAFINKALASGNYRFFRITARPCSADDKPEIETYLDLARESSRARAGQLAQELESITTAGELTDITREICEILASRTPGS